MTIVRVRGYWGRSGKACIKEDDQTLAELCYSAVQTAWCPTCGTAQDIPKKAELTDCTCIECGQNLGDDPQDREIEIDNTF